MTLRRLLWLGAATLALIATGRPADDAQYTDGPERCLGCHAAESMHVIAETAHGNANNPYTPYAQNGCESCHGPGSLHASRARGGPGLPQLIQFGPSHPVEPQTAACMACHAAELGDAPAMTWSGSQHDTDGISCSTCHDSHVPGNPMAERDTQIAKCNECHEHQIANHRRFESQGIVFDRLICYDCHAVHDLIVEP